jgi:hypothetical protein
MRKPGKQALGGAGLNLRQTYMRVNCFSGHAFCGWATFKCFSWFLGFLALYAVLR